MEPAASAAARWAEKQCRGAVGLARWVPQPQRKGWVAAVLILPRFWGAVWFSAKAPARQFWVRSHRASRRLLFGERWRQAIPAEPPGANSQRASPRCPRADACPTIALGRSARRAGVPAGAPADRIVRQR